MSTETRKTTAQWIGQLYKELIAEGIPEVLAHELVAFAATLIFDEGIEVAA